MQPEVRLVCPSAKYGMVLSGSGKYRVRCKGKFCKRNGTVTFHVFDLASGKMLGTEHLPYQLPRELLG